MLPLDDDFFLLGSFPVGGTVGMRFGVLVGVAVASVAFFALGLLYRVKFGQDGSAVEEMF